MAAKRRLRPISPFSFVGQGHKKHKKKRQTNRGPEPQSFRGNSLRGEMDADLRGWGGPGALHESPDEQELIPTGMHLRKSVFIRG
jgi:hypothetical protein